MLFGAPTHRSINMRRTFVVILVLLVPLVVLRKQLASVLVPSEPRVAAPVESAPADEKPPVVRSRPATLVSYGTARAPRVARLSADLAGEIVELPDELRPGHPVRQGEVLLRIDDREYRQLLAQAESALAIEQAKLAQLEIEDSNLDDLIAATQRQIELIDKEYAEILDLFNRGTASPRECRQKLLELEQMRTILLGYQGEKAKIPSRRDELTAECGRRRAEIELAKVRLEDCTIDSPIDGQVWEISIQLGERVQPGGRLLSLMDTSRIEVVAELPVADQSQIELGAPCVLSSESMPGTQWTGRVARLAPAASESKQTFQIFIEVDNTKQAQAIRPGSIVRADIDTSARERADARRIVP